MCLIVHHESKGSTGPSNIDLPWLKQRDKFDYFTHHVIIKHLVYSPAYQTFGPAGKLSVEVSMMGFMMGTAIAFFVVMGDLAPPIVADLFGLEKSQQLRTYILMGKIHS